MKKRLNAEETFKSIMGKTENPSHDAVEPSATEHLREKSPDNEGKLKDNPKEKLIQTAFYITKKQHRALKVKAALGDDPENKDQSAIVRAAIDAYLADTLKTI